jgi:hypothetical protein
LQTPTPLTSLAAINALTSTELVEYCNRYCPDQVYTGVSGAGLGADGEERGRERVRVRARRVREGWLMGGMGMGVGTRMGMWPRVGMSASAAGSRKAGEDAETRCDVPVPDLAYAALGL